MLEMKVMGDIGRGYGKAAPEAVCRVVLIAGKKTGLL
jgi:hypothetical protein